MALTPERKKWWKKYSAEFKKKHGCSPMVFWRRNNPVAAAKHRADEKHRWHTNPATRARHKEKSKTYRIEAKIEAMLAYGGIKCVCCGESELAFLSLDHVNDDGAAHRRSLSSGYSKGQQFYVYLKARGFPDEPKLQVLCFNCNLGKRINKGICPHQEKETQVA